MTEKDNIDKRIKRNIYGKPQSVLVSFPPGLSVVACDEVRRILGDLWFKNKFSSKITILNNALRIDQIHMSAVMELLMRGTCFSDIRLIVSEGKVNNMAAFEVACSVINWDFYLTREMSIKLKVDSGASPALHEGAMKDELTKCLKNKVKKIVSGNDAEDVTLIYVDIYKYHSIISLSLAGAPLFKRGYRSMLSSSAPLREDIAACCIQKAFQFGLKNNGEFTSDTLIVPFSGTGTFLIEYWVARYQFSPVLFDRVYSIQEMPLFRSDTFKYLVKKAREHCSITELSASDFYCVDNAKPANNALLQNVENFNQAVEKSLLSWGGVERDQCPMQDDFLKMDVAKKFATLSGNIFLPINPPYGIRLGKGNDTVMLYRRIAHQINALSRLCADRKKHVLGFILCPSEDSWSVFCKTLKNATTATYHLTQGGLDIRVAQFYV